MNLEIERKFLVSGDFIKFAEYSETIKQGFISSDPERAVRVRIKEEKAFITIKGKSNKSGTTRFEFETEISRTDAEQLLLLCKNSIIEKTRNYIPAGKHTFEVDVFEGENKGLILAEIELSNENEVFIKPEWLGKEVTGDVKYFNLFLSKNPFSAWKNDKKIPFQINLLKLKMIEYFGKDTRRINHALKVHSFTKIICETENINKNKVEIIEITAILHDIGIIECQRKYNSTAGKYQEIESPIIAEKILTEFDLSNSVVKRILYIISKHHSYSKIDGIDFQILVEADFLVNFEEGNESKKLIPKVRENIFKTETGIDLLDRQF